MRTTLPTFLFDQCRGRVFFFLVAKQRQKLATENNMNKLSLSAVLHWVAHSGGLCCSDSLCLHDYWKVSLLRRANRITLSCSDPCSSSYTNLLVNYTVIASRHPIKIWHRQGWSWEKKSHLTAGKQCSWISVHCYTLPSRFINNPSYKAMIIFFWCSSYNSEIQSVHSLSVSAPVTLSLLIIIILIVNMGNFIWVAYFLDATYWP